MPDLTSTLPPCPHCGRVIPANSPLGACPHCLLAAGLASEPASPADAPPPPPPAEIAPEFPQLEIVELLGRGGMGAVYKARQPALDRLVALKLLRPGLDADPSFAERFAGEARTLAQLNHPGIVTLFEFGRTPGGRYFILMEFVDGLNLRQLLAAGRLSPREALAIVPPLCDALQYAHDRGLVHRDIKPENILIDRLGRIKIADFGLAKLTATALASPAAPPAGAAAAAGDLTETGKVMGTPRYMAPEQREHPGAVDHRADIYALGVVLYQMLTGELPDASRLQPPSRRVQIDVRLDEIVLRALEADPARRYQHASLFKTQVETVGADLPAAAPAPDASAAAPASSPVVYYVLGTLLALYWGWVATSSGDLPARIASHFDFTGRPDAYMSRRAYAISIAALPAVLALLVQGLAWRVRRGPAHFLNIPNRHFWLAPERRAETGAFISRWVAALSCLVVVLFAQLHTAVVLAHDRQPPRLPEGVVVGSILALSLALMLWIVGLLMRFAETRTQVHAHRWRNRFLVGLGVGVLALGTVPLAKAWRQRGPVRAEVPASVESVPVAAKPAAASPIQPAPATPTVAAPGPNDTQRKIFQLKLDQARRTLQDARARHDAGLLQTDELRGAEDSVAILEAEFAGDAATVRKVQLAAARRNLQQIEARHTAGLGTSAEVDLARTALAVLQLEHDALVPVRIHGKTVPLGDVPYQSMMTSPRLQVREVLSDPDATESLRFTQSDRDEVLHLSYKLLLVPGDVAAVTPVAGGEGLFPTLRLELTAEGEKKFTEFAGAHAEGRLAVLVDGRVVAAPRIVQPIASSCLEISERFTVSKATALAEAIRAALPPADRELTVTVLDDGACYVGSARVTFEQLNERFAAFAREAPRGNVRFRTSGSADPASLLKVMQAARSHRLHRATIEKQSSLSDLPFAEPPHTIP